jgi:hypothetical protein
MGVWYFCFKFVNFVAVLTNSFLLCFVSFKTFESIKALAAVAGMFLPHVASIASHVLVEAWQTHTKGHCQDIS